MGEWGEPCLVLSSQIYDGFAYMIAPEDEIHLLCLTILLEHILLSLHHVCGGRGVGGEGVHALTEMERWEQRGRCPLLSPPQPLLILHEQRHSSQVEVHMSFDPNCVQETTTVSVSELFCLEFGGGEKRHLAASYKILKTRQKDLRGA